MAPFKKVSAVLVLLLIGLTSWLVNYSQQKMTQPVQGDIVLEIAVNRCGGITERAAAHLVAVVEFQRLEIAGRKARVFKNCMKDQGYIQNRRWLKYSMPVAEKIAKETKISVEEALENLRRANMMVAKHEKNRPSFWVMHPQINP